MAAVAKEVFEPSNPDPIERLARIEGESNFSSLLAGIEAGKDTTQDMAALAFSRARGCVPEVLEAYVAQSGFWHRPLMSALFAVMCDELKPKEADKAWMRGAVADAFLLLRYGHCKRGETRAKHFKVSKDVYYAIRKLAHGVFVLEMDRATQAWERARGFGEKYHHKSV
jgi:hypothetical protein